MMASECQQSEVGNKTKGLNEISQMNEGDCYDCLLMIVEKAIRGKFKKDDHAVKKLHSED